VSEEQGREWIVEPPGAGEVKVQLAVGDGVELTQEQKAALNELLQALEGGEAEVVGHSMTHDCTLTCGGLICSGNLQVGLTGSKWSMVGTFTPRV
jgi:hypothetical protein